MEKRDHIRSSGDEDTATESAILQHLLTLHPATVTTEEIAREMGGGDSFAERDAVERAVRDLAAVGLLHLTGSLVLPSRAALRFDELLGE